MTSVGSKGADTPGPNVAQLRKHFDKILQSKTIPKTKASKLLFLQAVCSFADPTTCVLKLKEDPSGLLILQDAMRCDVTPRFMNTHAYKVLNYLSAPQLSGIADGAFLHPVILALVQPSIFWAAFLNAFRQKELQENAEESFAWLLLQLVRLPDPQAEVYISVAEDSGLRERLTSSPHASTLSHAHKLYHFIDQRNAGILTTADDVVDGPGGRHDNDFVEIKDIAILPTAQEVLCQETPFLRPCTYLADLSTESQRTAIHLDNQFRLLREDMMYELRDDLQVASGQKKKHSRSFKQEKLRFTGLYTQSEFRGKTRNVKWAFTFQCAQDFPQMYRIHRPNDRKKFINEKPNILRHQSLTCLMIDDQVTAFPSIFRDVELLSRKPPIIVLQFDGCSNNSVARTISLLPTAENIKIVQIDTAVFSYEPVLSSLQVKATIPLSDEILHYAQRQKISPADGVSLSDMQLLRQNSGQSLKAIAQTKNDIILDKAQHLALLSCLEQRLSLVQGPPGTGKSFIGALVAKLLRKYDKRILVVCYTNHALDQFLEDLVNIGIPKNDLVRIGGKANTFCDQFALHNLSRTYVQPTRDRSERQHIASLFRQRDSLETGLKESYNRCRSDSNLSMSDVLVHLQVDHEEYAAAFELPDNLDDEVRVGPGGRQVRADNLIYRWYNGQDAGWFSDEANVQEASKIWSMSFTSRRAKMAQWKAEMQKDSVALFAESAAAYNECLDDIERAHSDSDISLLLSKGIIGCTTTGAAKYRHIIQAARPNVLLVEEAGEILESHVLTALSHSIDQLILIGDHQQLRPKVNNYALTVAKGDGYDLNRSLFERLILEDYPHVTLRAQHRMRPEISKLVKELSYPDLQDAPKTLNRPDIYGLPDNVIFFSHAHPEDEDTRLEEQRDGGSKSSKQNSFEADMILKTVKYLGQQGYGTEKLVILTPYLGQLRLLQDILKAEVDPVLSDLDSFDLVRAGLVSQSSSQITKKRIRLATIDNYQGEESDIVLISLTRSNAEHSIGFLCEPERLTVLLSRARNGLIMIGNPNTFQNAKKGGEMWTKLFTAMKRDGHVYDGLPTRCERHKDRTALLKTPDDFDRLVPDGGCAQDCGALLSCGSHTCPQKCHQISDHSKYPCDAVVHDKCLNGHPRQWKCKSGAPPSCPKCDRAKKETEKKQKESFERQEARDARLRAHQQEIAEIDEEMKKLQQRRQDENEEDDLKGAVEQKRRELEQAKDALIRTHQTKQAAFDTVSPSPPLSPTHTESKQFTSPTGNGSQSTPEHVDLPPSAADARWQKDKDHFGERNDHIDALMQLSGLDSVKDQFLRIKDKISIANAQGTSVKDERFHICALGNPGTGKTTVARIYAKFLVSVGALSGSEFIETTGSKMANDGVDKTRKVIESCISDGGGVIFVDEAYQLVAEHNYGGKQVLDYLLAEMENQRGSLTFIFAGYNNEMEKFMEFNPGIPTRIGAILQFDDYDNTQLLDMLVKRVDKKFKGRMKFEEGPQGLYTRICIKRLGRGRGQKGFGNARSVENLLSRIGERQSTRLNAEKGKKKTDFFLYTKEDLIGPDPSSVMRRSPAWKELQGMIGLVSIKASVQQLYQLVIANYKRELAELEPYQVSLNRVFLGNPGTGKTSVAKLYGKILAELGLLSKGHEAVVLKQPSDFVGSVLGESEKNTKGILENSVGKVLVIDEAYSLFQKGTADPYRTAVIDTIVAEVQSVPGEDRCVLLLGYRSQMEEMFQNVNPGLARRFAIEDAFEFADYSDDELRQALEWKLKKQDLKATDAAKDVAIEVLSRKRNRPNFGNIGEVENMLSFAKQRFQQRQSNLPESQKEYDAPFVESDFDPDFDRGQNAAGNLQELFADVVGSESLVKRIRGWQSITERLKTSGSDPREFVPTNFIFSGPPGTGKTTTARKMGQVYYDLGFLQKAEVLERSATDMMGQYVGQTGPKVVQLLEQGLGRVLFIDEAYRLSEGAYGKEAMDELTGLVTQEKFKGKLIVILAGYTTEMNHLLETNPGLSSRFPEQIHFPNLSPEQCLSVLKAKLAKNQVHANCIDNMSSSSRPKILQLFKSLSQFDAWGNARDVETLSKKLVSDVLTSDDYSPSSGSGFPMSDATVIDRMGQMLQEYTQRASIKSPPPPSTGNMLSQVPEAPSQHSLQTSTQAASREEEKDDESDNEWQSLTIRDPGVSDAIWKQLQADKKAAEDAARRVAEDLARVEAEREEQARLEAEAKAEFKKRHRERAAKDELMRLREQARLREVAAAEARARAEAAIKAEEERKRQEQAIQTKLRRIGQCVAGFQWVKTSGGYRCSAGGHFVTDAQLGI